MQLGVGLEFDSSSVKKGGSFMIVTVTLNPAFDKPLSVDRLQPGGLHRVDVAHCTIGKGINVSLYCGDGALPPRR